MPATEIELRFPDADHVSVRYDGSDSGLVSFASPVTDRDRQDIRWYIETYGAHSLSKTDDEEAKRIQQRLAEIGKALFDAVFTDNPTAGRLFYRFQDADAEHRVLTIDSQSAAILALPWELLRDRVFLFREHPRISVRRRVSDAIGGRTPRRVQAKDALHLLFVVSRPSDMGFIDPRTDPAAVLDALDQYAQGRVTWEMLRPATLDALTERLNDETRPPVDILHFDGHGGFEEALEHDTEVDPRRDGNSLDSGIQRERHVRDTNAPVDTGFLVFEQEDGTGHLVSARDISDSLFRAKVGLMVLSACQSAMVDAKGDPMVSVAGSLASTGIPAILAMTHSVLAVTTRALFGRFYESLARGRGIAAALDDARTWLANHPEKFEVRRGNERPMLRLDDWFLPALFHNGEDSPLLNTSSTAQPVEKRTIDSLRPRHEAGFFGRRRELWQIERWLAGKTRRVSITGFGGQGKTELALEAARWLLRTNMFRRSVFIDFAQVQSVDVVSVAVSIVGTTIGVSLIDAKEAGVALAAEPTLVVLDNLERLEAEPLSELLDVAAAWSTCGETRVLLTSRDPDHHHPAFRIEGTYEHRRMPLGGLGSARHPDDALDWYAALAGLPGPVDTKSVATPTRDELIALFDQVAFHPLSIAVLAQLLRTRSVLDLGERLGALLDDEAFSAIAERGAPANLIVSIQLSLNRLSARQRLLIRNLGVFQGGAMEDNLLAITGLDVPIAGGADEEWPELRRQLESTGLIVAERVPGVDPPFIRFYPTLAAILWTGLGVEEKAALILAHRRRYHAAVNYLYDSDARQPEEARNIVQRELPNLLCAVNHSLVAEGAGAVDFARSLNFFLVLLGRTREAEMLTQSVEDNSVVPGSKEWFLVQSNRGEQLFAARQFVEAQACFKNILDIIEEIPNYELAVTLLRIGRCMKARGAPELADEQYRRGIDVAQQLVQTELVVLLNSTLRSDIAGALMDRGRYKEAKGYLVESLKLYKDIEDLMGQGVVGIQLGSLALNTNDIPGALRYYRDALILFQRLREPASEAVAHHQLGLAFRLACDPERAEHHLRESARLKEQLGDLIGAARSWTSLATIYRESDKKAAAENWLRTAIEMCADSPVDLSIGYYSLALVLYDQPGRLAEARQFAEKALVLEQTLTLGATQIWKAYNLLARIADLEFRLEEAKDYRRRSRETKRRFAGTSHELKPHLPLIYDTIQALTSPGLVRLFEMNLVGFEERGWTDLVAAIRKLLSGERDADILCAPLDLEDSMIIDTILQIFEDPSAFEKLVNDIKDSE